MLIGVSCDVGVNGVTGAAVGGTGVAGVIGAPARPPSNWVSGFPPLEWSTCKSAGLEIQWKKYRTGCGHV